MSPSIYVPSPYVSSVLLCPQYLPVTMCPSKTCPFVPADSPSRCGDVKVYVFDINQPSLPSPFCCVLVSSSVFMALSTVFQSINSLDSSPLSHSVLPVWCNPLWLTGLKAPTYKKFSRSYFFLTGPLHYMSLYESLPQQDVILCGWQGSKHQPTNSLTNLSVRPRLCCGDLLVPKSSVGERRTEWVSDENTDDWRDSDDSIIDIKCGFKLTWFRNRQRCLCWRNPGPLHTQNYCTVCLLSSVYLLYSCFYSIPPSSGVPRTMKLRYPELL